MMENTAKAAGKAAGALTLILAPLPTKAQVYGDGMGMWHGTWGWGHMAIGSIMMVLFWAAVIGLIVWLVRGLSGAARNRRPSALEVLEERFARGEINREEFEEKRQVLIGRADEPKGR